MRQYLRKHVSSQLFDETSDPRGGTAIYVLADPRDIRHVRYVGQSNAPRRRFLQHLSTARLWLPVDCPWWVKSPKLRPLYEWIRALYQEGYRLPVMVITAWMRSSEEARIAEQARIYECLRDRLPLLNVESEDREGQMPLI